MIKQTGMKTKRKLGFIGGGVNSAIGRAHYTASVLDGLFEVVAGCFSRHASVNQESAAFYGVANERTYPNVATMVQAEGNVLDAVVILSPTSDHGQALWPLIEAGIPVICEKAMVSTVEDAAAITALLARHDGFLAMTYNYTGYPALREMQRRVREGYPGRLLHLAAEMPLEGYLRIDQQGQPIQPQAWRLHDGKIPTVYLDLGSHLHQIIHYVTGLVPESVSAVHRSYGHFPGVVDYVDASVAYSGAIHGHVCFGKSLLGHRNGLRIRLYGDEASLEWVQTDPEILRCYTRDGQTLLLERGGDMPEAALPRYTRFKSGHPAGYVEAFANLYADIHHCLSQYALKGSWSSREVFGAHFARDGLVFLQTMADAAESGQRLYLPLS